MAHFEITRGPSNMNLMFALFDEVYPRTVKFTVQGMMYGKREPRHDSTGPMEEKIRREIFDEDIGPHEIEVSLMGLSQGVGTSWVVDGKTIEATPQAVRCFFFPAKRDGTMLIGTDAEENRLWCAQHPELYR